MGTLTPAEFAAAAGVYTDSVYRWVRAKHIRAVRVGKRGNYRIPQNQLAKVGNADVQARPLTAEELAADLREIEQLVNRPTSR